MNLPDKNESYKLQKYWNERFSKEDNFEWCKSYVHFKELIQEHVQWSDRILMLGCGNSRLSEDMHNDGYRNIVNIDFSPVVIENMKRKYQGLVDMQWIVMDITKMAFPPSSFDVVIEKATLDALLVEEKDPWKPSKEAWNTMASVLSQVSRILKKEGRFISITFSQPHFRKPFLAKSQYGWSVSSCTFGDSFHFFFYVMKKGQQLSENDKMLEKTVRTKMSHEEDSNGRSSLCFEFMAEDTEDFLFHVTL